MTPSGSPGRCPSGARTQSFASIRFTTDALDEIRREVWNEARKAGDKQLAKELKGARFVLWENAGKLTDRQKQKLSSIQQTNKRLYRAYLLSQQLREIYRVPAADGLVLLDSWLKWARRCRLEPFRKLARRITEQRERVEAAFTNGLSNARVEQINTQIRLIIRRGFGYHSEDAVIALAMLSLGGLCPPLPGR